MIATLSWANAANANFTWNSELPPRLQWLHNDGYCGEVSTIAAGLKFGQYLSQYDLREIAALTPRNVQTSQSYLVGLNDIQTAGKIRLDATEYEYSRDSTTEDYLVWIKNVTRSGFAVTMTIYMNQYRFYGLTNPEAGDVNYDHIVSIHSVESRYDDNEYHADDVLTFSDHGLWAPLVPGPPFPYPYDAPYLFSYAFGDAIATREEANLPTASVYSVPFASASTTSNFGVAHSGPTDKSGGDLVPVHVAIDVNYEAPQIGIRSEVRPASMVLVLNVTVAAPAAGVEYTLYRYDDEAKVPTSNFNALNNSAVASYRFLGPQPFQITESILSDEKVFFRAVRSDAL
jgi:hypothetical protein